MKSPPRWPRSLFGRLTLILCCGLTAAHLLSFALVFYERTRSSTVMMLNYLSRDIASSIAILERLPPQERAQWLGRLQRRQYKYELTPPAALQPAQGELQTKLVSIVQSALQPHHRLAAYGEPGVPSHMRLQLQLADGMPLGIELSLSALPLSPWMLIALALQLVVLLLCSWLAVRFVTRPMSALAQAAEGLSPHLKIEPLDESGPLEVARAAIAFNAMQGRIANYLNERMQILAAVSHDLQTPITRMRLRADLLDDTNLRDKLHSDLDAMQALVQEGIAYARDGQGLTENARRTDLNALLDTLVCDYVDAGKNVRLNGMLNHSVVTRPHTVSCIVANLVDNALKFGQSAEIILAAQSYETVIINVLDRGPGIPEHELTKVLEPFYRIESSRNRDTGGTGLGSRSPSSSRLRSAAGCT